MFNFNFQLPPWLQEHLSKTDITCKSIEDQMRFVINLASLNIEHKTGGPFGAGIFDSKTGKLLSCGINLVESQNCSVLHAEIVAIIMAQKLLNNFDLGATGMPSYQLVTSVEPCAMCLGAIGWSGIQKILCGARDADARMIGFDEGIKPENWIESFRNQGVIVTQDIMRQQASDVLKKYKNSGGLIYNPDSHLET